MNERHINGSHQSRGNAVHRSALRPRQLQDAYALKCIRQEDQRFEEAHQDDAPPAEPVKMEGDLLPGHFPYGDGTY